MQQQKRPGFESWEKWALMSVIILALAGIIIYFNLRVFGWLDGAPYIAVVGYIVLLSFLITRHIKYNPVTYNFLRSAFAFEVLLTIALGVNVVYSLSVMREMSVAGQGQQSQKEMLDSIGKLRGSRNQGDALKKFGGDGDNRTRVQVFTENERVLFWIMMGELGIALIATFVLLGLSVFDKNKDGVMDVFQSEEDRNRRNWNADPEPVPIRNDRQLDDRWAQHSELPQRQLPGGQDRTGGHRGH